MTRRPLGSCALDPLLRDWLTHAQSLTARIRSHPGSFAVRICHQGRGRLHPAERRLLGGASTGYRREVLLLSDGVPVVWARTVLRPASLRGPWRFLGDLGTRPLGERLFVDPAIARTPFAFLPRHELRQGLAARRAVLLREGARAVLTEVLLAGLLGLRRR